MTVCEFSHSGNSVSSPWANDMEGYIMGDKARNYTDNTVKQLYGLSGNACANPECRKILIENGIHLGEIAHIAAASSNGPRFDSNMDDNKRRDFKNLILL